MIIIDKLNFVYVHIPKCAGTTIKKSNPELELTQIDNGHGFDSTHLPLSYIKVKDPSVYAKILNYESYAHVRDPIFRFRSALFQHSREYLNFSSVDCDDDTLLSIAHDIARVLLESDLPFPEQYEHFTPQHEYLEEDGALVVKNVSVIGDFKALNQFYARNGLNPIGNAQNVSLTPKLGWFNLASNLVKPIVRRLCPVKLKESIWERLVAKGYYVSSTTGSVDFLRRDEEIMEFINTYYSRDFDLFEAAEKSC